MKPRSSAEGVVVAAVRARTPAAEAGLHAGDRILTVNGHAVRIGVEGPQEDESIDIGSSLRREKREQALESVLAAGVELVLVFADEG